MEEMAAPEEPVSENTEMETPEAPEKHKLYEKLKKYYPDREFGSDSEVMDAAHDKLSENDSYHEETEALLQNISDAVDADPEYAQVTAMVGKGMSFREAVARCIDPEDLQAYEGDPDYESLSKAKEERMSQREQHKARIAEIEANSQESAIKVDQFAQDNNLSDEETAALLTSVETVVSDIINGKISPEFLAKMLTAENHVKEVEQATENARIEGQNTAIEEKLSLDSKTKTGDGVPEVAQTAMPVVNDNPKKPTLAGSFLSGTGILPKKS